MWQPSKPEQSASPAVFISMVEKKPCFSAERSVLVKSVCLIKVETTTDGLDDVTERFGKVVDGNATSGEDESVWGKNKGTNNYSPSCLPKADSRWPGFGLPSQMPQSSAK